MRIIKSFKLKIVFVWVLVVLVLCGGVAIGASRKVDGEVYSYKIVLDAGHGGRDDGCSGVSGAKESEINLKITKKIKNILEDYGYKVYLTREDENGLYKENVDNYKQSDMKKRIEIIEKVKPNFVISIHQNSYSDSSQKGAQVFYEKGDELSKLFAESVQSQLFGQLENARKEANFGDYYILNETKIPAIIVECGYLTNNEEEQLLLDENYQTKVAYAIVCGIVKYYASIY